MTGQTSDEAAAYLAHTARQWRDETESAWLLAHRHTAEVVQAAVDCLVAGLDTPSLRALAGLPSGAPRSTVGPVLLDTLRELDIPERPDPGSTVGLEGLRELLALVLDDVRTLGLGLEEQFAISPGPPSWESPHAVHLDFPSGSWMIHPGTDDQTPADELERLADQVHEWVVEELPGLRRPTNWPVCPAHPTTHPLEVRQVAGDVVWVCPRTEEAVARVGELSSGGTTPPGPRRSPGR
ncbi:hypothetical protein [Nocardioides plantarum]|uniref:DUF222 domain-containing protein n=1 Tax=Nocardioides plantarum TaxID=29299 RepID=A0ABV5KG33_9ACTN|nr:hypothetical protein [Nocardioides plantarum]